MLLSTWIRHVLPYRAKRGLRWIGIPSKITEEHQRVAALTIADRFEKVVEMLRSDIPPEEKAMNLNVFIDGMRYLQREAAEYRDRQE